MDVIVLRNENADVLQKAFKWSRPDEPIPLSRCRELVAEPANLFLAATSDAGPIGLLTAYQIPRPTFDGVFLYEIDVHPQHRRQGVGTQMIESLKEICRTRGIAEIFVLTSEVNTAAMRLYRKTGGVRPNPDDVLFVYDLAQRHVQKQ